MLEPYLQRFRGKFLQTPPPVSAKKVAGKPAYELARKNIAVELEPVEVQVYELTLLGIEGRICVYALSVRRALICGGSRTNWAAKSAAARISISFGGPSRAISHSISPTRWRQLQELARPGRLNEALIPAAQLLPEFPAEYVDELRRGIIRQGRDFQVSPFRVQKGLAIREGDFESGGFGRDRGDQASEFVPSRCGVVMYTLRRKSKSQPSSPASRAPGTSCPYPRHTSEARV